MPGHNTIRFTPSGICASPHFDDLSLYQWVRSWLLLALVITAVPVSAQETLISNGATWRWRQGTNEVSNPTTLWRTAGFNDAAWSVGNAPFHYGEGLAGGTLLSDMRSNYTCVFLRTPFVLTNVTEISQVQLAVNYDDGFVAWINGTEVARVGVTNASPFYTNTASLSHEAATAQTITLTNTPVNYLVAGLNELAVQAFNVSLTGSGDFRFETLLQITKTNLSPPVITNVSPAANAALGTLTQITVSFNQAVSGVDAADLLINDQPAAAVSNGAGTNRYTFSFTQPLPGLVSVNWNDSAAITDVQGAPFDSTGATGNWNYTLSDSIAPLVGERTPVPGALVGQLTQVEVVFSEPVLGVDAIDLRINGQPAASVTGAEAGPYVFHFAPPATGTVGFSWAASHSIADLAANPFVATNWSVTLNTGLIPGDVTINEFVAGNLSGPADEDGELPDWIELYNRGTNAVNLLGWSLTDNPNTPGLWPFPSKVLNPGEYLVVFASGKDRRAPTGTNWLHTSFKLDLFGEYLGLFNAESPRVAVSEFPAKYPEQRNGYSYGLDETTNDWRYFQPPTPGSANGSSAISSVAPTPHFSVGRGCFNTPFNLLLTTPLPDATIRYTTDGSEPTLSTGQVYSVPLPIANTTIIRAAAFATGHLPSRTRTHSYLYLDSVLTQPNEPPGFPSTWGTYASFSNNIVPADYEMDLDPLRIDPDNPASPVDPAKLQRYQQGLRELPVVSIAMSLDDIFNPPGMYHTPNVTSKSFPDKPCSIEMVLPDGTTAFAVSGGLSIHGNASREPRKNPKHGFKLSFKGEFGESSLKYRLFPDSPAEEFDDLIVRADFGSSWRHQSDTATEGLGAFQRTRATRTRDAWWKDTFRDMGQVASHSRYCHLFINGLYWGTYDFSEQPNASFAPNYFGGTSDDYDVYEQGALKSGTSTAYTTMTGITDLANNANYELMKQYLDIPEFADYTLLHFFVGAQDWGYDANKNWYAVRKRVSGPAGAFKYLPWDGENLLLDTGINQVTAAAPPSGLHPKLTANAQYRLDFADRVHRHMITPNGALTPAANITRWAKWMSVMDNPIVAESCRWGDYRRDVHNYPGFTTGAYVLYTREGQWLAESNRIVNVYLPGRTGTVLGQLRAAGLYPILDAPEYRQTTLAGPIIGSGSAAAGEVVALRNPGAGTIYYTTNGSDPRVSYSGVIAASALPYSSALTLNFSVTLKSRVLSGGTWSALNEATFTVGVLGVPLRFTELMYNPVGGDAYEFLELQNVGALPLDLGGFSLQGITHLVPEGTVLPAGATLLLANNANPAQFAARYPSAVVAGYFAGNLANGGERVAVLDRNLQTVTAVHYDDEAGWPTAPDGGGDSLEIIAPRGDPNAPANWRASAGVNGTPGLPPVAPALGNVVLNEIMADNAGSVTNGGLFPDWIELRNLSGAATNLAGWSVTDDSDARQFVFPANTLIPAGGYLVVWCDAATNAPGLHSGFALGRNGETISLFDANTNRADALTFGLQLTDQTVGRLGNDWQLTEPTPNGTNVAAVLAAPSHLAINEWLADPGVGGQDWLELFNRSSNAPVALRGLYLGTSNVVFQYPALSFLAPQGYAQLFAEEQAGADQLEFKLSAAGGDIVLSDPTGAELERVAYGAQTPAVSEGRLPDGNANITAFAGSVSPGAGNYLLTYTGPVLNEVLARNDRAVVSPWGTAADFVELFNASGSAVSLAGMAIGDSDNFNQAWKFPDGASIAAGGYVLIWCEGAQPASTNAAGGHNTGFALAGASGAVVLFNALGQPVDSVGYGVQLPDQSLGRNGGNWELLAPPTPGSGNAAAAPLGSVTALRLNEWMAAPLTGDDWFELYNPEALPVDLSGLYLTDNPSTTGLTNSPIAPLSFIGGHQWARFTADGNRSAGRDHVNFSLDQFGETLRLYDPNLGLLDAVDFGLQMDGGSQGRLPDGTPGLVGFPTTPTPGAANYLPLTSVVINEILTHTDAPLEDAVELFNPTANPVDLSGWYLSDSQSDLKRYLIPGGTVIPAGGFQVFYQNQFGPADGETDTPPLFTFNSAHGDAMHLSPTDGGDNLTGYRASVTFNAAANGVSFGRYPTSVGVDFVALHQRTFGVDNPANLAQFRTGTGATNAEPLVGPVVINEIMYHPPADGTNARDDAEYLELLNLSGVAVPLFDPAHPTNRWRLANAVSFDFPANTTIPAGGRLLVVPFNPVTDATALTQFQSRYGGTGPLVGPYASRLDNAGETVELWRPDEPQAPPHPDAGFVPQLLVERVTYAAGSPWPTNADGFGPSLQRLVAQNYGNDPVNWKAAPPTAGLVNVTAPVGSATLPGEGLIRLTFTVQPGLTYQLEYQNHLTNPSWLPLGPSILSTNSPLIVDDNLASQPQRFYRLLLVP